MPTCQKIYSAFFARFKQRSLINSFSWILFVKLVLNVALSMIVSVVDPTSLTNPIDEHSLIFRISLTLFLGPLFETFLFQYLIFEIGAHYKIPIRYQIPISALSFALAHSYNLTYILAMVISGTFYAFVYLYYKSKTNKEVAFAAVFFIHTLSNLVALLLNLS